MKGIIVTLLLLLSASASAQTVYGPGGLFIHPTASAAPTGLRANLSFFTQKAGANETRWTPASLTFSADGRSQYGALYVSRVAGGTERPSGGAFAKYQLVRGSVLSPSIALTGSFLGGDVQQSSLTVVGSGRIPATTISLHSGMQWARRADLPVSRDGFSRFLAVDWSLGSGLRLVAESGSRYSFNREAATAYGLMWSGPRGFEIGLGWVNIGRSDSNRFFIGAGITVAAR